jgi:hypothetical protein
VPFACPDVPVLIPATAESPFVAEVVPVTPFALCEVPSTPEVFAPVEFPVRQAVPELQLKTVFVDFGPACSARTAAKLEIAMATPTASDPAATERLNVKLD